MTNDVKELSNSLAEFQQNFMQLSNVEEPPQTLLHILHRETKETYWNKILSYFLDPAEPHGFGTDLLEAFLSLLDANSELDFEFDRLDFEGLKVKSEWVMRGTGGIKPDITIYREGRWFVCIEMKVGASEHEDQTSGYVGSEKIGTITKSDLTENDEDSTTGHNYVFLAREGSADADADQFVNIPWREVIETLSWFERQSYGRYPAKSQAQLNDFLDTIRREVYMTDEKTEHNQIDKMRLYFEYADTIDKVESAFDAVYEREKETWQKRFLDDFRPANWGEEWCCGHGTFGHIHRKAWRCTSERKQTNDGDAPYRISLVHNIRKQSSFKQGTLTLRLYCPPGADDKFRDEFNKQFHSDKKIHDLLGKRNIKLKHDAKQWYTMWSRSFDEKQLPKSYYETLRTAFEEHQEVADDITRIFEATLNEITSE